MKSNRLVSVVAPAGSMEAYPVSNLVNSAKNQGPEVVARA